MIAYLKGTLVDFTDDNAILEVNQIGYNVRISSGTAARLPRRGEQIQLYTYTCVREDAFLLYGFLHKSELDIFKQCITVNGIGPKGGLALLSVLDADGIRLAIMSGDAKALSKAPGIGVRTAERLILDLKGKISIEDTMFGQDVIAEGPDPGREGGSPAVREAIEALVSLGYGRSEATKAVTSMEDIESMDAGAVLKAALKKMF